MDRAPVISAGIAFLSSGGVVLGTIVSTKLESSVLMFVSILFLILGTGLLVLSLFCKDERTEIDKKRLELEIAKYDDEKIEMRKNDELPKIEQAYKIAKTYLLDEYIPELENEFMDISFSAQPNDAGLRMLRMSYDFRKMNILSKANLEDKAFMDDLDKLWDQSMSIMFEHWDKANEEGKARYVRRGIHEVRKLREKLLENIEKKIAKPESVYGS